MKSFFLIITITASFLTLAQTKTTKEAKIIAVVTNSTITAIEHFEPYKNNETKLVKKHPKSKFFIGLLKGRYEVKNDVIIPQNEAIITIYTEKQIFHKTTKFPKKELKPGEVLTIGKTKAKVIAVKKGELIIKTNN